MDGTIGEIRLFAGSFAPNHWAFCFGQTINISDNQALFSILGTQYGGNGVSNFNLPDLRSRVPIGTGKGTGLSNYYTGQLGGTESVRLTESQMPAHSHLTQANAASTLNGSISVEIPVNTNEGEETSPANGYLAPSNNFYSDEKTTDQYLGSLEVTNNLDVATNVNIELEQTGESAAVYNVQPYLGLNYIICADGLYPQRS